jgi:hypothetical protein
MSESAGADVGVPYVEVSCVEVYTGVGCVRCWTVRMVQRSRSRPRRVPLAAPLQHPTPFSCLGHRSPIAYETAPETTSTTLEPAAYHMFKTRGQGPCDVHPARHAGRARSGAIRLTPAQAQAQAQPGPRAPLDQQTHPGTRRRWGRVAGAVSSTARGEPVVVRRRPVTPVQFIPYAEGGRLSAAGRGRVGCRDLERSRLWWPRLC